MTMRYELLAHRILEGAAVRFPRKEIVTRVGENTHRYTYADLFTRTARLGNALRELGGREGRPGGHVRVEQLPAPGGVLRAAEHRGGGAYH